MVNLQEQHNLIKKETNMPTSRDLIDAINTGKSAVIQSTFEAVMSEKIDNAIEAYRQAVIENMFESEELDEEDLVEDADNQSIDLSEYTLEEIQEFMESEDFAALDELSKATLGSYVSKAALDAGSKAFLGGSEIEKSKHKIGSDDAKSGAKLSQKAFSRVVNIGKAAAKLSK